MNKNINISCAILAGGKAKRMNGENKALLKIGEKSNLEKIIAFADKYFGETLIISNHPTHYNQYQNVKIFKDIITDIGPLGGIHSALKNAKGKAVFFFPCDMPFINTALVEEEIKEFINRGCEIIVPKIKDFYEPLHSIYSVSVAERFEQHIKTSTDLSVRSFFSKANVFFWELEDSEVNRKSFININTKHDLLNAIGLHKPE
ncbi:MAG TPA: molybdenum cofactor guanylyltransferase [Clostridiales bacterium]|nr:molybdenum cofactor guanylyltransferase [Clostridiales bacterium]HQP69764.1 molybdenum cofactor guanylyltransferase [Clostridiales bacterium]